MLLAGCVDSNESPNAAGTSEEILPQPSGQPDAAVVEREQQEEIAREKSKREEEIRQEQARIDGIRRANELDAMEREVAASKEVDSAYAGYMTGDPQVVPRCESAQYAGMLKKMGLERLPNHPDSCMDIGSNGLSVYSCPPCQ